MFEKRIVHVNMFITVEDTGTNPDSQIMSDEYGDSMPISKALSWVINHADYGDKGPFEVISIEVTPVTLTADAQLDKNTPP